MRFYATLGALNLVPFIGSASSPGGSDAVTTFAQLGVTGIVSVVLYLWQRETSKKLDKSTALNEELVPLLTRVLDVIQASNAVHQSSISAMASASDSLKRVPTEETFTRIKVALERSEAQHGSPRGGT